MFWNILVYIGCEGATTIRTAEYERYAVVKEMTAKYVGVEPYLELVGCMAMQSLHDSKTTEDGEKLLQHILDSRNPSEEDTERIKKELRK